MACRSRSATFRDAFRRLFAHPAAAYLVVLGTLLVILGIVLRDGSSARMLIFPGVAVLVIGIVLPVATSVSLGADSLSFTRLVRDPRAAIAERDAEIEAYATRQSDQLLRLAELMAGRTQTLDELVKDAIARAYVHCPAGSVASIDAFVLCTLAGMIIAADDMGLLSKPAHDALPDPAGSPLEALPVRLRVPYVLKQQRQLSTREVSRLLGMPEATTARNLDEASHLSAALRSDAR